MKRFHAISQYNDYEETGIMELVGSFETLEEVLAFAFDPDHDVDIYETQPDGSIEEIRYSFSYDKPRVWHISEDHTDE